MIVALWKALRGFYAHGGFFLAAGLSFYFLICLIPLLFLFVSLSGSPSPARGPARSC